jgi:hypothetical protein
VSRREIVCGDLWVRHRFGGKSCAANSDASVAIGALSTQCATQPNRTQYNSHHRSIGAWGTSERPNRSFPTIASDQDHTKNPVGSPNHNAGFRQGYNLCGK